MAATEDVGVGAETDAARPWSIRPAVMADLEDIARLRITTLEQTYGHLLPRELFPLLPLSGFTGDIAPYIEAADESIWVAVAPAVAADSPGAERIVGWSWRLDGTAADPAPTELKALYTLKEFHGQGVGAALATAAIGAEAAFLWVEISNARAQRFYAKRGFTADGPTRSNVVAGRDLPTMRMSRRELTR